MTLAFPSPEFDDAVAAVCHDTATEAEMRALNALLRSDSRARDEYLVRVELHARLASEPDLFCQDGPEASVPLAAVEANRLKPPVPNPLGSLPQCPLTKDSTTPPPIGARVSEGPVQGIIEGTSCVANDVQRTRWPVVPHPTGPAIRRRSVQVLALAASLVLAAAGVWSLWFRRPATRSGATSTAVAMLTRAVDARWDPGTAALRVGSPLEPGWLRLESGLAQVVFYSGARLVIEGPAALQLVSPNEAVCPTGRLLAEVPPPARGFRLKTDQLNVVDLGTAFGIQATPAGTEVHVFKGQVELRPQTAAKQSLAEGRAAVVQGNAPPRFMRASKTAFAPLFEFQQRSLACEAYRYEHWQFASAELNEDPSLLVRLDFETPGSSDWTLRNAAKQNHAVPEATIVGCQRAEGRWREKPALDFQSVNDRVRLAVPGAFDALTLSAWVCVKGLDRQFNSLFMCDGFAPGTIHWLIRNDGVLGLTVIGAESGKFQILASPPVLTLDAFGMWLHLAVVLDGKAGQVTHYVNGTPVSRHGLKLGPPFRVGPAELGNWNSPGGPDPAPVLIRNLSGSLDEFELFGRALTDSEVHDLYVTGKPDA